MLQTCKRTPRPVEEIPIIASLPQYQMEQVCHQILNHFQAHETPAQPNDPGQL